MATLLELQHQADWDPGRHPSMSRWQEGRESVFGMMLNTYTGGICLYPFVLVFLPSVLSSSCPGEESSLQKVSGVAVCWPSLQQQKLGKGPQPSTNKGAWKAERSETPIKLKIISTEYPKQVPGASGGKGAQLHSHEPVGIGICS